MLWEKRFNVDGWKIANKLDVGTDASKIAEAAVGVDAVFAS